LAKGKRFGEFSLIEPLAALDEYAPRPRQHAAETGHGDREKSSASSRC
jgi:hypothetical protein